MKRIEKRFECEGRSVRVTNFIDQESLLFEAAASEILNDMAVEQTTEYCLNCAREFYLVQMRTSDQKPSMQSVIRVNRSPLYPGFATAVISRQGRASDAVEEEVALAVMKKICFEIPGVMTLRLQPHRITPLELMNFQARCRRQGFHLVDPLAPTRTLILNLESSAEELYAKLPTRTRIKIRHHSREKADIRVVTDADVIPVLRAATGESFKRSLKQSEINGSAFDFETALTLARTRPDQARVLGFYLKTRPDELLAYVIGMRRGKLLQYASAGSLSDPELRSVPFNTFLLWELMNWGRTLGSTTIDLGGVTDGAPKDPMSGISRFKRSLSEHELEVGRETISTIRPVRHLIYQTLKTIKQSEAFL